MAKRTTTHSRQQTSARRTRRALPKLARLYATLAAEGSGQRLTEANIAAATHLVVETANHEAAHAVVCAYFGELPLLVTIERSSENFERDSWGYVRWRRIPVRTLVESATQSAQRGELLRMLRPAAEKEAMISLAGIAIEQMSDSDALALDEALWANQEEGGMKGDVGLALDALASFERNEDKRGHWMFDLAEQTIGLVQKPELAATIEKLAKSLLNTPTIKRERLANILMPVFALARRRAVKT